MISNAEHLFSLPLSYASQQHRRVVSPQKRTNTPLHEQPVVLAQVFSDVQERFRKDAQRKIVDFSIAIDPCAPHAVLLDKKRFQLLIVNIVGSAIKLTQSGFIQMFVETAALHEREGAEQGAVDMVIEVSNTNGGISAARRTRILAEPMQAHYESWQDYGGIDVELQMARNFAERLSGSMYIENLDGVGATIYVVFRGVTVVAPEAA
jgi:signal transduction histidine kinase